MLLSRSYLLYHICHLLICTRYNFMCISNLIDDWWFPPVLRFFPSNASDRNTHEPVVDIIIRQIT
jgi:hypothetical protein